MEPGGATSLLDTLIATGPVGAVLVLILLGWIVPKGQVDRLQATVDRLLGERNDALQRERELRDKITDQVVPLMTRAIDVLDEKAHR